MTTCDLIANLAHYDVVLTAAGDRLLIDGPESGIVDDADVMWHVADRKVEILAILGRNWPAALRAMVERVTVDLADDLIDQFEERAGIYQHDANLDRSVAEELAYHEIAEQIAEAATDARIVGNSTRVRMEIPYACTPT